MNPNERPRFAAVLGLGFGDCGKGLYVDFLCRRWRAHTVVRFNGGAQAGHNVVLPDGRHHTFAQFGAGCFVPGVHTLLASPVVVHPSALLVEDNVLQQAGVSNALARLEIDARCRINTPFHQAAGRIRELMRCAAAHGTCGVGVGETVRFCSIFPELALRYADLCCSSRALEILEAIRQCLLAEFEPIAASIHAPQIRMEWSVLCDSGIAKRWLDGIAPLLSAVPPATPEQVAMRLNAPGTVLFEGAQGALLDEWHGFHPHTTWSTTLASGADEVLADVGIEGPVTRLGVLRSYLTRHGQGPFPTYDPELDCLAEPHNSGAGWQGDFRRGHPDMVLLRYAKEISGRIDGLLVSHLDVFERGVRFACCEAYRFQGADKVLQSGLPVAAYRDLDHQTMLTKRLEQAEPVYAAESIDSSAACLARYAAEAACRVLFGANGSSYCQVFETDFTQC